MAVTGAAAAAVRAPHHKFTLRSEHNYLKIAILTEDGIEAVDDAKRLKFALDNTLKTVFGVMGASASEFDILAVQRTSKHEPTTALLRVRRKYRVNDCILSEIASKNSKKMVVLQHESLHQTLWGPAAPNGRSRRTDGAVYTQLVVYALLSICCALDYEKPAAVRLAAAAAVCAFAAACDVLDPVWRRVSADQTPRALKGASRSASS
ncbi:hypothetical protein FI667_g3784, partial [Globisporangium splendens]